MSIRSGGRPRGERPPPRYEPDAYATESIPRFSEPYPRNRNGRGGRGGGRGIPGFIKFLLFALILGGFVIVVGLTALSVHQGPGVTNALTGIIEAAKSRTPLVVIAPEATNPRSNFFVDLPGIAAAIGAGFRRVTAERTATDVSMAPGLRCAEARPPDAGFGGVEAVCAPVPGTASSGSGAAPKESPGNHPRSPIRTATRIGGL